jgi:hypothetical protein
MIKKILLLSILNLNSFSGDNDQKDGSNENCKRCSRCPLSWNPTSRFLMLSVNFLVLLNQSYKSIKNSKLFYNILTTKKN